MAARTKPKRSPVSKKAASKTKPRKTRTKIKRDPWKEHMEASKKWGLGDILDLSDDEAVCNIPGRISTGSFGLDKLLVNEGEPPDWCGVPMSRVTEIYGPSHIGKSTLLDQMAAETIRRGGVATVMDTENSRDRHYVSRLFERSGLDALDRYHLVHFNPENTHVENVLRRVVEELRWVRKEWPDLPMLIGWDALAGTATEDEVEKGIASEKKAQPGAAAKAMAQAARLVLQELKGSQCAFVICNHEYENISMGPFAGPKRKTYGGDALRHMASLRIQLYSGGKYIKGAGGEIYGREVVAKIVKNRLGRCLVDGTIPMITGMGSDNVWTLYHDLKSAGYIEASGSWASINIDGDAKRFQGWLGLRAACSEDPELYARLVGAWRSVVL